MGRETGIAWTDATFNPWWGCTKISPGCDNCYAAAFDKRVGGSHWGKDMPRREFGDKHWAEPVKWDRNAEKMGVKTRVFCASMADVMDDEAPDGARDRLWELIDGTPHLIWQLLTKRPHRYTRMPRFKHDNVWLGASAENQEFYDIRWPLLLKAAALAWIGTTWISYEPALGPLDISSTTHEHPSWVICGGESGAGRRPMNQVWADKLRRDCAQTGTAFFMKQMSARTPAEGAALIPVDLIVRQFPA